MMNQEAFPSGWIEQLQPLLGDQLPDFLHSYDQPPLRGIRMRPGRTPIADAGKPVPWAENGYYLPLDSLAGAVPAHDAGAYYLQEPSAMAAAAALHPQPDDRVLDLCAAPGGKSTQLAVYMQGRGVLVCNEPVPSRAQVLSRNMERMGVKNAVVISALPEDISGRWTDYFDKILVDAPCSGEGMFRRHPETRLEWNAASPAGCAQRQKQILTHAARMLRPGGMLAYSTCTFNPTENEGVIQAFLHAYPAFSLVPFALPGLPENDGMLHLWPHQVQGEGHFVALLKKAEDALAANKGKHMGAGVCPPGKGERALAQAFLTEQIAEQIEPSGLFAGHLVMPPEDMPPIEKIKVLRLGLHLGEIKGKVFIPDHALALACTPLRRWEVTEEEARRYQQGEVLTVPEGMKGFYVPALDGLSLGWGKASDGQLKNHYPKGLRR
ncbi:MAG: RsmF rRNA methyltransferase first C-terminal domain-containing protein [Clostridia bacterium]|nr:RsmF rRNA methyltransferase first C-terminal domain-containing protein [Clostridia bacterium]